MTRETRSVRLIPYKDTNAWPGSELFRLLTEAAAEKDPKKAQDLRKKAEQCYNETEARYRKSIA